jgi:hypothetical protein
MHVRTPRDEEFEFLADTEMARDEVIVALHYFLNKVRVVLMGVCVAF